jgi:hypothetical protein
MPSSVDSLLSSANLQLHGQVKWGEAVRDDKPGVYLVSISADPTGQALAKIDAPISIGNVKRWLVSVTSLRLDGGQPDSDQLATRLAGFWLPDETILYIGKASTSVSRRVDDFHRQALGKRRPHCGGSWAKALAVLDNCTVYWSLDANPVQAECQMLKAFMDNVSDDSVSHMHDPRLPLPFANLELRCDGKRQIKRHGLTRWKI